METTAHVQVTREPDTAALGADTSCNAVWCFLEVRAAVPQSLGGRVETMEADGEYGRTSIRTTQASELYQEEIDHAQNVWMSHGDKVAELPEGFHPVATSEKVHCPHISL